MHKSRGNRLSSLSIYLREDVDEVRLFVVYCPDPQQTATFSLKFKFSTISLDFLVFVLFAEINNDNYFFIFILLLSSRAPTPLFLIVQKATSAYILRLSNLFSHPETTARVNISEYRDN